MYKIKLMTLLIFLFSILLYAKTANIKKNDLNIFSGTIVEENWQDIEAFANKGYIVLLPISVIEEHGPHLDLSPDVRLTNIFCKKKSSRVYYRMV